MNLLRKLLRGIYYFCVGIKTACSDLIEWYTSNKNIRAGRAGGKG